MRESLHKQRDTSPQTAIFIAKNELGMTDKVEKSSQDAKVETLTPDQNKYFQEVAKVVMERMRKEKEAKQRESIKLINGTESTQEAKTG